MQIKAALEKWPQLQLHIEQRHTREATTAHVSISVNLLNADKAEFKGSEFWAVVVRDQTNRVLLRARV
jgi:hypothetical protein